MLSARTLRNCEGVLKTIKKDKSYLVQSFCAIFGLVCYGLLLPELLLIGQTGQGSVVSELQMIRQEQSQLRMKLDDLDKAIAILQISVQTHHSEQEAQKYPERVAVLEVRQNSVDNKLNIILGVLGALLVAFVAEFMHRVKMAAAKDAVEAESQS